MPSALDLKPVQKLPEHQIHPFVKEREKPVLVVPGKYAEARKIHRGKAQVPPPAGHLPLRVVDVADHSCPAPHVRNLRIVVSLPVILEIERRIQKAEVWEQPLGARFDRQAEQIVAWIIRAVVDSILDLEDLDREDRGFPIPESRLCRQEKVADYHASFL